MKTSLQESLSLWREVPFLHDLPDTVLAELARAARRVHFTQGQTIFLEEEPTAGLFLVEEGRVKICRYAADGREHTLLISGRGDTFNDVSALDGGPNPACAVAFSDAILWPVSRDGLRRLSIQHPELAWALIESLAQRARYLIGIVQDPAMRNVKGRLARLLLDQAEAAERGTPLPHITQEEMANQLGTVREVVGRALRSLAAEGILTVDRQRIEIVDRARLQAAAEV
ncbi:MAG: Crp/Fnr family transcriptional regulator [Anaerolineales bacterium]|nr:Crp/Fnr family transcriptional regulator [Anaerolineales bacterium]